MNQYKSNNKLLSTCILYDGFESLITLLYLWSIS